MSKHNLDDLIKLLPEAGIYRNGIYGDECYAAQDGSCRFDIDTYPGRLALAAYAGAVCLIIAAYYLDAEDDESMNAMISLDQDFHAWAKQEDAR